MDAVGARDFAGVAIHVVCQNAIGPLESRICPGAKEEKKKVKQIGRDEIK